MESGDSSWGGGGRGAEAGGIGEACQLNGKSPGLRESSSGVKGNPGVGNTRKAATALKCSISTSVKWLDSIIFSSSNGLDLSINCLFFFSDFLGPDLARI